MKIVICGAGITGLALANRMATLGHDVVLLERSPGPRSQGYMIDFFGTGYDAVEAMGLLPAIQDVAYHVEEASLLDKDGHRRARLRYTQLAKAVQGRLLSLMRPDLERVLRDNLPPSVDLRFGTTPTAVNDRGDQVTVTLDNGTDLDADLLVGADGIHSTVRRLVFGPESRFLRYLGFHTAAFQFTAPRIHTAVQDRFCLTDTIGREMGFYALRDGRVATFAVHRTPDPALPDDARTALRHNYRDLGWVVPEALDRCPASAEIYYDQVAQIQMPRWSTGRVALVGDAGYAVSLLAGQGASLGIGGAYVLAHQLDQAPSIEQALTGYERLWRPVAEEKQKTGRAGARWFLPDSAFQLRLRWATLHAAGLPVVNRYLAAILAGKSTALITNLRAVGRAPRPIASPPEPATAVPSATHARTVDNRDGISRT